jgi:nucleoside-diphosphate-sugar epimerase
VKKKICIIGATSYLGSKIAEKLKNSYDITLVSKKKISENIFDRGIKKIKFNFNSNSNNYLKLKLNKFNVLIYCISKNHFNSELNLENTLKVNVSYLIRVFEILKNKKRKPIIIYLSTAQLYGSLSNNKKIYTEESKTVCNNVYSLTHKICEDVFYQYFRKYKFTGYILRLSNIYGNPALKNASCWWLVLNSFVKSAIKNNEININSDGTPLRDFVYIDDFVSFINYLINKKCDKINLINFSSGKSFAISELASIVEASINKKININFKVNKKNSSHKHKRDIISNKKLKKIGFKRSTNLHQGIKKFIDGFEK